MDGAGSYNLTLTLSDANAVAFRAGTNTTWLGSTGRTQSCSPTVLGPASAQLSCSSSGTVAGPTGSGQMANVDITGLLLEVNTPSQAVTVTGTMDDAGGDDLAATALNGSVRVVKCPDVNGDRVGNFPGDVIAIARAALGQIPQLPVHDINNDSVVNFPGDAIIAAKIVTTGQPPGLRCVPN
jgi:hypothetical protein